MSTEKRIIQYAVGLHEGLWKVRRDGKSYGPYPSYEAALTSAIDAAHMSGKNDRAAQVLVQGEDGVMQAEWTSGVDPYPPQGASVGTISSRGSAVPPNGSTAEGWSELAPLL